MVGGHIECVLRVSLSVWVDGNMWSAGWKHDGGVGCLVIVSNAGLNAQWVLIVLF